MTDDETITLEKERNFKAIANTVVCSSQTISSL